VSAPAVSILLPADPDVAVTLRALQALARLGEEPAFEVVIAVAEGDVPNGQLVGGLEGDVRVVIAERGEAFDRAADAAGGAILVALEPSALPADGWLGALVDAVGSGDAALPRSLTRDAVDLPEASWLALAVRSESYRSVGGFAGTRQPNRAEKLTLLETLVAVAAAPTAVLLAG
jgi:hypothetical protein